MPSSEQLFNAMIYVLYAGPAAVVVAWAVWRLMVWCLFYTRVAWAWGRTRPAIVQVPLLIGLVLCAWPLLLLSLLGWPLTLAFPALAAGPGETPRLFARSESQVLSYVFLFLLFLPLVCVPMGDVAYRLEGPKISFWHWTLVFGPIPVLAYALYAYGRRERD